VEMMCQDMCT